MSERVGATEVRLGPSLSGAGTGQPRPGTGASVGGDLWPLIRSRSSRFSVVARGLRGGAVETLWAAHPYEELGFR